MQSKDFWFVCFFQVLNADTSTHSESPKEIDPSSPCATSWIIATISSLSALLLLVGLYHFGKFCQGRGKKQQKKKTHLT